MTTVSQGPVPTAVPGPVRGRRALRPRTARGGGGVGEGQGRANWLVKGFLILICFLWVVPTIGLLVTSLRNPDRANETGWWTVLTSPLDFTQWTLSNYSEVATESNMGRAFINSLIVTIPATIIPILIAAFAAYAFTFM